jgi:sulfite reductase beta subunit-like hemoprotein
VRDALALSARLAIHGPASRPVSIHLSGCEKCCAQRRPAEITLLARPGDAERYDLFVRGDGDARLGRLLRAGLAPDEALATVERLASSSYSSSG